MSNYYTMMDSPLGPLRLMANEAGALTGLYMQEARHSEALAPTCQRDDRPFRLVCEQLTAYFASKLTDFELPLALAGTPFQRRVWQALLDIPFGSTESYGALARRIGLPKASRAVGAANGRNPVSIIVPCHRVIGANGSLTGYGGGMQRKRWLLAHEGRQYALSMSAA